ncbi:MAG: hypothetical protein AAGJ55_02390 [Cyanobacteria bacterium J06555_12]
MGSATSVSVKGIDTADGSPDFLVLNVVGAEGDFNGLTIRFDGGYSEKAARVLFPLLLAVSNNLVIQEMTWDSNREIDSVRISANLNWLQLVDSQ